MEQKKSVVVRTILLIISAAIFVLSAVFIIEFYGKNDDFDKYKNGSPASSQTPLPTNPIDFTDLKNQNPDVCGWIAVDDTAIDYPIMQSGEDKDEDFYLTHNFEKEKKFDGSIYIQRCNLPDFSDTNTIIYGHDLANGKMFTPLRKFRQKDYFESHDTFHIYKPGHILTYKIFSAFIFDDRHVFYSYDYSDKEGYGEFLSLCFNPQSRSKNVREGVSVTTDDKIVTLSTCTDREGERYLIVGVLTDDTKTQ